MPTPNLLQRARAGLFRLVGGTSNVQIRRFNAAKIDRLSADWLATEQSLNQELRSDLNRLRSRGRDLVQNNDYAVKFKGMVTDNIIGPGGIRLQVRVQDSPAKPDRLANAAIETAWADWSSACDITGQQSLRDLCETLVGGLPSDGEFLVRMIVGSDARNKYNIALQVIDVDRIDTTYHTANGPNGNAVIMGVEVDQYRRPVALHIFASHPNDGVNSSRQRMRISVEETLHRFKVERAEQMRGIPWMSAGMLSLYHLGNFKLAALLAAEHGANHYGFFNTPDGIAPVGVLDQASGTQITTSQPGTYDTLPAGVTFTAHESKYPDTVFGPFVKTTLQRIASGWRVAYHSLANDLEGVNYSSIRSGSLEERDRWSSDQQWFIAAFMEPVYKMWLKTALLSGAITMPNGSALPAAKLEKFSKHEWQPRRWEWVDPKGDMEAKILAVKAGLMAPQDLAAAMGYDFDDTLAAIALAQNMAADVGVKLTAYDATPGSQSSAPPAAAAAAAKSADPADAMTRQVDEIVRALEKLTATHQRSNQPGVALAVDVTASAMDAAITKAAAPYFAQFEATARAVMEREMTNIINVPEQAAPIVNVNVAAPNVTLEATVPAAQVVVNNTHPKRAEQSVKQDAQGEIVSTSTVYEF
jgi:lambda family phage portal protein